MPDPSVVTTFLFTDIEGSTRLWEQEPARMRPALARHDALARAAVESNGGTVVKMIGDGMHAAFDDPLDAVIAALRLQDALLDPRATEGVALRVRCGLHAGVVERRDEDFFGAAVNRAARIMSAAHGGQVLLSQAVAALVADRLPDDVTLRDLGALRLRDLASPEHIHQLVHPRLSSEFPPLRTLESVPNNLPQQLTSFVGRDRELAEVGKMLAASRLVTLHGTGGIGKTRLSLQAAADALSDFPDGTWFVDLAPLADALWVPQAVASVLGVKEEAGRPVAEALVRYLRERRLLVILDNCEHVISASAELVAELLQAGPNVKVIATSREALNVSGEHTYPVPALGVPEAQLVPTPAELWEYGAVRLFVARATSVDPAFAITPRNAPAIVEICRQLDGIPLALELAAARVRALAVESIAARLSDRFGLLARGDRAAIPRQQTLRALIDWSYDLLDEKERLLFRRLGVFAGGWTLEAVEAVGAGGDIDTADVVDLQAQLVDKSLVEMETEGGRYRMLSTVRQYALERLDASPDIEFTRSRHLHFYLQLAESASQELVGPDQGTWLARLDLERENLLTAHARCDRADRGAELGLRFVFAVKLFMINRGLLALLHRITVEALTRSGAEKRSQVRCRALHTAGQLACFMGRYGEAQGYLTESLAIARELEDRRRVSAVLEALAMAALGRSDVDAARGHLEEAIKLTRELGDKRGLAAALNGLAQLHRGQGALDAAEPIYLDVLALAREMGDREIVCIALLNLAMVLIGRDTKARVPEMLAEVLAIAEDIGSKPAGQSALEVCAGLAAASADWIRVARLFGAAEAHMSSTGLHRDPTDEAFLAPLIDAARQSLGERDFARANDAGRALPYDDAIAEAREWLGRRP